MSKGYLELTADVEDRVLKQKSIILKANVGNGISAESVDVYSITAATKDADEITLTTGAALGEIDKAVALVIHDLGSGTLPSDLAVSSLTITGSGDSEAIDVLFTGTALDFTATHDFTDAYVELIYISK